MRNRLLIGVLFAAFTLGACSPTSNNNGHPTEEESDNFNLKSIALSKTQLKVVKGTRDSGLLVYFSPEEGLTDDEKAVTWSSENNKIATVDQYGRVSGVEIGTTYFVCTSVIAKRKARCMVKVVNSLDDATFEYQKVDDITSLKDKDTVVIAAPKNNKVATLDSTGSYLHASETTFSSDGSKILSLGVGAAEFYVGKETHGYTLEGQNGKYFAGFNLKRVGFVNNKGNTEWMFTQTSSELYIETYNDVRGVLMFNSDLDSKNGGFTLYEREESNACTYTPTIYRLVEIS